MKPANCPQRKPEEGSEASDHGPLLRNTANASQIDNRVNQTGADSKPRVHAGLLACSEPMTEEPYALVRARTGLWEPWVGNRPGPPGPRRVGCSNRSCPPRAAEEARRVAGDSHSRCKWCRGRAGGRFGAPKSIASNRMVFVFVGSLSNLGHLRGNQGCSFQN
jgi:hypothetical protein